jgi:hypothetical protein
MDATGRNNRDVHDFGANGSEGEPRHAAARPVGADLVRTSRLAVAACVLAGVSFLLLPGLIRTFLGGPPHLSREVYQITTLAISLLACLLGIVSLGRIGFSGGRLVGKGLGWVGVAAPVVQGALLLLFILPNLPRSTAFRMACGTHLSAIGKAVLLYSNDYQDELPRAGGPDGAWGQTADWMAPERRQAYGLRADGSGGAASVSSCLYLLVKFAGVPPKTFLCGGTRETREKGVSEFKLSTYRLRDKKQELIDLWDFGPDPTKHCSYAYQMLYGPYRLTVSSSDPAMAIAGDRNPWMDAPAAKAKDFSLFTPEIPPFNGTSDQARQGNTSRHKGDGQSVLFLDTHATFEKRSYCGFENDNIYTSWEGADKIRGQPPKFGSQPVGAKDSLLVNDSPALRK